MAQDDDAQSSGHLTVLLTPHQRRPLGPPADPIHENNVQFSGHFGTVEASQAQADTKRELACVLAGALAFSAVREGDRVGLISFTDRVERYIPPRKTRSHVTRLLHELLFSETKSGGTSLTAPLNFLNNLFHRPALVFVISDFHDADETRWTQTLSRDEWSIN